MSGKTAIADPSREDLWLEDDPLWYKDAIIYELHVRSFFDSDGDGIGDFCGLVKKLDYIEDLGATVIWLLPFYPSPLKDDGYDIANYTDVHLAYGTRHDFEIFLREAHRRGLRVIIELTLNHTSDKHPWFRRARRAAPGTRWRDFYVWSDTSTKYKEARIIFQDFELSNWTWDPLAQAYYWHRFYSHQPDLNYENPLVRRAITEVVSFWIRLGVDGMRLDAVPYLYEREGTSCENLPETHAFLKELRSYVDQRFTNRLFLAEANQWPQDAAAYFGDGDECHMNFHFPLMPRLFMAMRRENCLSVIEIFQQTPPIPESCQWALFLRNHDELTLEMVTDEDRAYMWQVYAANPQARINLGIRRRLAPLSGNNRRQIELLNGLLFSLPGTPVVYYGDEIGMGDNIHLGDRDGVRTPMQWSADRNAGFSLTNPQQLYLPVIIDPRYHYEVVNVEVQQNDPHSLLVWMKRLLAMRKRFKAFGRGTLEFLPSENRKILAFLRHYESEYILVVANLSRFVQYAELDLSSLKGMIPVELSSQTKFPAIGELPYLIVLGSYAFYWFTVESGEKSIPVTVQETQTPSLTVTETWENMLRGKRAALEAILPDYLKRHRWFGGKARTVLSAKVVEAIPVNPESPIAYITLVQVEYTEGNPELYVLPLTFAVGERAAQMQEKFPQAVVARLQIKDRGEDGVLYDALWDSGFSTALFESITHNHRFTGTFGEIVTSSTWAFRPLLNSAEASLDPVVLEAEQSNTSVIYGERFILKLFRRLEAGVNPEFEIGRFLTEKGVAYTPPLVGALEYQWKNREPVTLAVIQGFVPNQGDAWQYTLNALTQYFQRVLALLPEGQRALVPRQSLLALIEEDFPPLASELLGPYRKATWLLGQRTAELHLALTQDLDDLNFVPEPFLDFSLRALYQAMLGLTNRAFQLLRERLPDLSVVVRAEAQRTLDLEDKVRERFGSILDRGITALRIRCHGDYRLSQVLYADEDFVIIDFEGEPARLLSERRLRQSPLKDVTSMLRSLHYAAYTALSIQAKSQGGHAQDFSLLEGWARFWYRWVSAVFLKAYLETAGQAPFISQTREELQVLFDISLLEKILYELCDTLNNRLDWVKIPLQELRQLLEDPA